jgi:hypothetical protein
MKILLLAVIIFSLFKLSPYRNPHYNMSDKVFVLLGHDRNIARNLRVNNDAIVFTLQSRYPRNKDNIDDYLTRVKHIMRHKYRLYDPKIDYVIIMEHDYRWDNEFLLSILSISENYENNFYALETIIRLGMFGNSTEFGIPNNIDGTRHTDIKI